ncbi:MULTISPECIES: class I SAM-dependent methyltransferase [Methylobacterium]|uniref:Methyltransferase type 11 domain-containing protein n=1 Tax=Methylobacterium thuringiense TaxID=1003091 RepID=A0ABQ4TQW9_9HYPH|nr:MULTISPECIES: class I SAM-dependent methyltransferase [Methylobacterium]TXN19476.1 class I SAM-dependent methyltransferase [Methylobacterium sp. WL9]GJE56445.1 hypothetical protein EKPJFOCH_2950 [Methylobacterium thuringiense]
MVRSMPFDLYIPATGRHFDEAAYLAANPDVAAAVAAGHVRSGRKHFDGFGHREDRRMVNVRADLRAARARKMQRLRPLFRSDMPCLWNDGKADFLTPELREATGIVATDAVSSHGYDQSGVDLIARYPDGLVLDCGAGSRQTYYENVVNYEIVDYLSTDVLGVGEALPFLDDSFDGVLSIVVLEHVRDPFTCAREIARVLKPGGTLYCCVPFLQPYHGFPHHYFNPTPQGARRLFEDMLEVERVEVIESTHPIWALQWILNSWRDGLSSPVREEFSAMTVEQLLRAPAEQVGLPFCRGLSQEKQLELACATVLTARKPLR